MKRLDAEGTPEEVAICKRCADYYDRAALRCASGYPQRERKAAPSLFSIGMNGVMSKRLHAWLKSLAGWKNRGDAPHQPFDAIRTPLFYGQRRHYTHGQMAMQGDTQVQPARGFLTSLLSVVSAMGRPLKENTHSLISCAFPRRLTLF
jgi:hypothetical protein